MSACKQELCPIWAGHGGCPCAVLGIEPPSFTCPRCGRSSWNPNDVREGYCGACHDWTGNRR